MLDKRKRLILFQLFPQVISWTVETRRSTLIPWISHTDDKTVYIGWAEERRDTVEQSFQVTVGWESSDETFSVNLPYIKDVDSLASSLWPSGLACAILCQSPVLGKVASKDTKILELGAGLGLAGQVLSKSIQASSCLLTDKNEEVVKLLQESTANEPTVSARYLEWRDEQNVDERHSMDIVIGSDIAYYFYLLRPLINTARHFMKPKNALFAVICQAHRESQWDLFDSVTKGSYNQETDEKEEAWPGKTEMLLYKLEMQEWRRQEDDIDEIVGAPIEGVVPIAVLLHQTPGLTLGPLTKSDYVAETKDREELSMLF